MKTSILLHCCLTIILCITTLAVEAQASKGMFCSDSPPPEIDHTLVLIVWADGHTCFQRQIHPTNFLPGILSDINSVEAASYGLYQSDYLIPSTHLPLSHAQLEQALIPADSPNDVERQLQSAIRHYISYYISHYETRKINSEQNKILLTTAPAHPMALVPAAMLTLPVMTELILTLLDLQFRDMILTMEASDLESFTKNTLPEIRHEDFNSVDHHATRSCLSEYTPIYYYDDENGILRFYSDDSTLEEDLAFLMTSESLLTTSIQYKCLLLKRLEQQRDQAQAQNNKPLYRITKDRIMLIETDRGQLKHALRMARITPQIHSGFMSSLINSGELLVGWIFQYGPGIANILSGMLKRQFQWLPEPFTFIPQDVITTPEGNNHHADHQTSESSSSEVSQPSGLDSVANSALAIGSKLFDPFRRHDNQPPSQPPTTTKNTPIKQVFCPSCETPLSHNDLSLIAERSAMDSLCEKCSESHTRFNEAYGKESLKIDLLKSPEALMANPDFEDHVSNNEAKPEEIHTDANHDINEEYFRFFVRQTEHYSGFTSSPENWQRLFQTFIHFEQEQQQYILIKLKPVAPVQYVYLTLLSGGTDYNDYLTLLLDDRIGGHGPERIQILTLNLIHLDSTALDDLLQHLVLHFSEGNLPIAPIIFWQTLKLVFQESPSSAENLLRALTYLFEWNDQALMEFFSIQPATPDSHTVVHPPEGIESGPLPPQPDSAASTQKETLASVKEIVWQQTGRAVFTILARPYLLTNAQQSTLTAIFPLIPLYSLRLGLHDLIALNEPTPDDDQLMVRNETIRLVKSRRAEDPEKYMGFILDMLDGRLVRILPSLVETNDLGKVADYLIKNRDDMLALYLLDQHKAFFRQLMLLLLSRQGGKHLMAAMIPNCTPAEQRFLLSEIIRLNDPDIYEFIHRGIPPEITASLLIQEQTPDDFLDNSSDITLFQLLITIDQQQNQLWLEKLITAFERRGQSVINWTPGGAAMPRLQMKIPPGALRWTVKTAEQLPETARSNLANLLGAIIEREELYKKGYELAYLFQAASPCFTMQILFSMNLFHYEYTELASFVTAMLPVRYARQFFLEIARANDFDIDQYYLTSQLIYFFAFNQDYYEEYSLPEATHQAIRNRGETFLAQRTQLEIICCICMDENNQEFVMHIPCSSFLCRTCKQTLNNMHDYRCPTCRAPLPEYRKTSRLELLLKRMKEVIEPHRSPAISTPQQATDK